MTAADEPAVNNLPAGGWRTTVLPPWPAYFGLIVLTERSRVRRFSGREVALVDEDVAAGRLARAGHELWLYSVGVDHVPQITVQVATQPDTNVTAPPPVPERGTWQVEVVQLSAAAGDLVMADIEGHSTPRTVLRLRPGSQWQVLVSRRADEEALREQRRRFLDGDPESELAKGEFITGVERWLIQVRRGNRTG